MSTRQDEIPELARATGSDAALTDDELRRLLVRRNVAVSAMLHAFAAVVAATLKSVKRGALSVRLIVAVGVAASFVVLSFSLSGGGRGARSFVVTGSPVDQIPFNEVSAAQSIGMSGDELLDARRRFDLAALHDALQSYAGFFGKYPSTDGALTTFCSRWTDAGCDVIVHGRGLPASDGFIPYWYTSDGATYTIMARMRGWPPTNDCPEPLRPEIGNLPALCVNGAIGSP
jgi:hypothetical protein